MSGRPVLNLSFALNYAVSGTDAWSYHVVNTLIHAGAGLLLFGIIRRTLRHLPGGNRSGGGTPPPADALALAIAALWTMHPLHTQAVTYTVQRAESLMGLFYLLTLYAFIRAAGRAAEMAAGNLVGNPAIHRGWSAGTTPGVPSTRRCD